MVVLGGSAVSYERGTLVIPKPNEQEQSAGSSPCLEKPSCSGRTSPALSRHSEVCTSPFPRKPKRYLFPRKPKISLSTQTEISLSTQTEDISFHANRDLSFHANRRSLFPRKPNTSAVRKTIECRKSRGVPAIGRTTTLQKYAAVPRRARV